jgi:hypothetical protein
LVGREREEVWESRCRGPAKLRASGRRARGPRTEVGRFDDGLDEARVQKCWNVAVKAALGWVLEADATATSSHERGGLAEG